MKVSAEFTVVPQLNQGTTKGIACPDFREAVIIPFLNFWFFCFKTKEQRNETIFFFSFFACTPLAKFKPVSGAGDKKQKKDIRKGLHPLLFTFLKFKGVHECKACRRVFQFSFYNTVVKGR